MSMTPPATPTATPPDGASHHTGQMEDLMSPTPLPPPPLSPPPPPPATPQVPAPNAYASAAPPAQAPTAPTPQQPPAGGPSGGPGPVEALTDLLAGNRRFVSRRPRHGHDVGAAAAASGGQEPYAVVVGCIDSRVPLEAIFDQTFGSICVVRSGGQVLDQALIGSVEFAVSVLRVPLVMVLGHERCGAVGATVQALRSGAHAVGALGYLIDEIAPAVLEAGLDAPDVHTRAMRRHVVRTVARLEANAMVGAAVADSSVAVVGAVYDLDTGRVDLLEPGETAR